MLIWGLISIVFRHDIPNMSHPSVDRDTIGYQFDGLHCKIWPRVQAFRFVHSKIVFLLDVPDFCYVSCLTSVLASLLLDL